MIVCYDASASPGRNIQRMGRTGRHGNGRVVYILAAGKETNKYRTSLQVCAAHVVSWVYLQHDQCIADLARLSSSHPFKDGNKCMQV